VIFRLTCPLFTVGIAANCGKYSDSDGLTACSLPHRFQKTFRLQFHPTYYATGSVYSCFDNQKVIVRPSFGPHHKSLVKDSAYSPSVITIMSGTKLTGNVGSQDIPLSRITEAVYTYQPSHAENTPEADPNAPKCVLHLNYPYL